MLIHQIIAVARTPSISPFLMTANDAPLFLLFKAKRPALEKKTAHPNRIERLACTKVDSQATCLHNTSSPIYGLSFSDEDVTYEPQQTHTSFLMQIFSQSNSLKALFCILRSFYVLASML